MKRIYKNSTLTTKTKLKLLPVTGHHFEFWGEGITSKGWLCNRWKVYPQKDRHSRWNFVSRWHRTWEVINPPPIATYICKNTIATWGLKTAMHHSWVKRTPMQFKTAAEKYSPNDVSILLFTFENTFTVAKPKNPQNDWFYAHLSTNLIII